MHHSMAHSERPALQSDPAIVHTAGPEQSVMGMDLFKAFTVRPSVHSG